MSIPLHSIDIFWRKLDFVSSMPVKDRNVDCKMFEKSSPHQSESSKMTKISNTVIHPIPRLTSIKIPFFFLGSAGGCHRGLEVEGAISIG
ncbi:hypothetical protein L6452_17684 [Arctium lappa]|uniref:Uncharacterized protein n=1 Tax=Arctium lappa TaxID=4217 RepID=A0ACB9C458_ARCLA|nr:hypothetical protein L6452_17684 [Arctium lappa]